MLLVRVKGNIPLLNKGTGNRRARKVDEKPEDYVTIFITNCLLIDLLGIFQKVLRSQC